MMDQPILNQQNVEQFAKAIARELLRKLAPSLSLDAIAQPLQESGICRVGQLTVDTLRHEATLCGQVLELKPREFALLACLARNPGRVFSRTQLIDLVWPEDVACAICSDRTVDVHVRRIRIKLGKASSLVRTVAGVGYKLLAPAA